jgi:hypothetical protein
MMRRWQQVIRTSNHLQACVGEALGDQCCDSPDRQRTQIAGDQPHRKRRVTQGIDERIG